MVDGTFYDDSRDVRADVSPIRGVARLNIRVAAAAAPHALRRISASSTSRPRRRRVSCNEATARRGAALLTKLFPDGLGSGDDRDPSGSGDGPGAGAAASTADSTPPPPLDRVVVSTLKARLSVRWSTEDVDDASDDVVDACLPDLSESTTRKLLDVFAAVERSRVTLPSWT